MNKPLQIKDCRRIFELELIADSRNTSEFNHKDTNLTFLTIDEFKEYLSIWFKYVNLPEYQWVRQELKNKIHHLGNHFYFECGNNWIRRIL